MPHAVQWLARQEKYNYQALETDSGDMVDY